MKILFYVHIAKTNKRGLAPLRLRITMGPNDRVDFATGHFVDPDLWDTKKKVVNGKGPFADIVNRFITTTKVRVMKIESDLQLNDGPCNAEIIRNIFLGNHIERYSLLQVLDMHNDLFRQKVGQKGFSQRTLDKYTGPLKKKIKCFIESKYTRGDIYMFELDLEFIESFWHFLTTRGKEVKGKLVKPMDTESACQIIGQLKKVARIGFRKQRISINPFDDFKATFSKESKVPLSMEEVTRIQEKVFQNKRLDKVRDRLVVGIFSGMSNQDIHTATSDMITTDINGKKWIERGRTKTGELCIIPLWKPVLDIIEKYQVDLTEQAGGFLFPRMSLQKMNEYCKEIAGYCNIQKPLTTHICRHTFGDIYLNGGGSLDNLARIMGHSSTKTTSGYAKRNFTTIAAEADLVRSRLFKTNDAINSHDSDTT